MTLLIYNFFFFLFDIMGGKKIGNLMDDEDEDEDDIS